MAIATSMTTSNNMPGLDHSELDMCQQCVHCFMLTMSDMTQPPPVWSPLPIKERDGRGEGGGGGVDHSKWAILNETGQQYAQSCMMTMSKVNKATTTCVTTSNNWGGERDGSDCGGGGGAWTIPNGPFCNETGQQYAHCCMLTMSNTTKQTPPVWSPLTTEEWKGIGGMKVFYAQGGGGGMDHSKWVTLNETGQQYVHYWMLTMSNNTFKATTTSVTTSNNIGHCFILVGGGGQNHYEWDGSRWSGSPKLQTGHWTDLGSFWMSKVTAGHLIRREAGLPFSQALTLFLILINTHTNESQPKHQHAFVTDLQAKWSGVHPLLLALFTLAPLSNRHSNVWNTKPHRGQEQCNAVMMTKSRSQV